MYLGVQAPLLLAAVAAAQSTDLTQYVLTNVSARVLLYMSSSPYTDL